MHPEKSPCIYMKFRNFTILLLSGNNEAVNKKTLAKYAYKPGGYMHKQVIVFAIMHHV